MSAYDDYDSPPPRMQPGTKLALLLLGACSMIACIAASIALSVHRSRSEQGIVSSSPVSVPHKQKAQKPKQHDDPYPDDCAIIRQYLKQRYSEEIEIISWGKRSTWDSQVFGSHAYLSARFRRPGGSTKYGRFTIGPFLTVEDASISD